MDRAQYIRDHYRLEETGDGWQATSEHGGICDQTGNRWSSSETIIGDNKTEVCRQARCRWGHFNFRDEAEAFGRIFPRG